MRGRVLSINISERKGIPKHPVGEAEFITGLGIKGDVHAGTPRREISLLDRNEIVEFEREKSVKLEPGAFAENLTVEGLDLLSLQIGTELLVGKEVRLRISQIGKECHAGCAIREEVGDCIMPRKGVFAHVVQGGWVKRNDPIRVSAAEGESMKILRWKDGEITEVEDSIAQEAFLHLSIDERIRFDVVITPEKIRPFVFGHLFAEGFINSLDEVSEYSERLDDELIYVDLKLKDLSKQRAEGRSRRSYNIIWTECGGVPLAFFTFLSKPEKIETSLRIAGERIIQIPVLIKDEIAGFKETGAYHYAFLFDKDLAIRCKAKDIGRHNAVDKVIGEELLMGNKLEERILFVTGRITSDIMMKCLRCKIPLTISKGAPLAGAIRLARGSGLGLLGFLRGRRFNIYSGSEMITCSCGKSNLHLCAR